MGRAPSLMDISTEATIAALVLAGGQSRRMGQDKALLTVPATSSQQATPLLVHVCSVAQSCASHTYVLTTWPERYSHLLSTDIVLLRETVAGSGPMAALLTGWDLILNSQYLEPPDWLLVLACDLPAIDIATLQRWHQALKLVELDAIAALPRQAGRWEPLCGFYHRRCLPGLKLALDKNISSFQRWLRNESVATLPVDNFNVLRNCNTPAQWQQFLADSGRRNL